MYLIHTIYKWQIKKLKRNKHQIIKYFELTTRDTKTYNMIHHTF